MVLVQAIGLGFGAIAVAIVAIFVVSVILSAIKVVKEYERGVISAQKIGWRLKACIAWISAQMLWARTLYSTSFICPVPLLERGAPRIEGAENIRSANLACKGTSEAYFTAC